MRANAKVPGRGVTSRAALALATAAGAVLSLPMLLPAVARGDARSPTIGVSEIRDGMKGYGLTVFKGTEPERFDVEVIGVLHNFRPAQDLILIKTPHPRLNIVKTVAGMSGSPIFLDGRLAGAYAYSLSSFEAEAVAGVTPIAPMLTELARPIPKGVWPAPAAGPLPAAAPEAARRVEDDTLTSFNGAPGQYDVYEHARLIARRMSPAGSPEATQTYRPVATPLMMSGVGDRAASFLRSVLGPLGLDPLQTGGGQGPSADAPQHFVDGGALGVELVRGDVSTMGLGTVTHVEGSKLCGFGHPMMNAGATALPTSIGRVLWINASDQRSFKVGETARPLGALIQDRQSAIIVDETHRPPRFPLTIDLKGIAGAPKLSWHMDVALEKFLSPNLAAAAVGSAVEATISEKRDMTWSMKSRLAVRGHGTIEIDDFGVAIGGMPEEGDFARSRLVRAIGDVLNNPWEPAVVDAVAATFSVDYARDLYRLRGAELLDDAVDAGQNARIRLHLLTYAGQELTREVEVRMPPELSGRDAEVEVVPGYEAIPDVAPPENLNELIANETRQSMSPRSLVFQIRVPSVGVLYHGHAAPRLPGFALDALRPAHADLGPEPYASYVRSVVVMDKFVEGRDKLRVRVRPVLR